MKFIEWLLNKLGYILVSKDYLKVLQRDIEKSNNQKTIYHREKYFDQGIEEGKVLATKQILKDLNK